MKFLDFKNYNEVIDNSIKVFLLLIQKKNETGEDIIDDVKFRTFGFGPTVVTSSIVKTMAKGMKVDDAYEIIRKNIAKKLDGLPPIKPML